MKQITRVNLEDLVKIVYLRVVDELSKMEDVETILTDGEIVEIIAE